MDYSFIHESSLLLGHETKLARFGTKQRRKSYYELGESPKELLAQFANFWDIQISLGSLSIGEKVREQASKCSFHVK